MSIFTKDTIIGYWDPKGKVLLCTICARFRRVRKTFPFTSRDVNLWTDSFECNCCGYVYPDPRTTSPEQEMSAYIEGIPKRKESQYNKNKRVSLVASIDRIGKKKEVKRKGKFIDRILSWCRTLGRRV